MNRRTTNREDTSFYFGLAVGLFVALLSYLVMRHSENELYRMAYNDAMKVTTTCSEAMRRVRAVCGSDKPSEQAAPPVFVPIPIPN